MRAQKKQVADQLARLHSGGRAAPHLISRRKILLPAYLNLDDYSPNDGPFRQTSHHLQGVAPLLGFDRRAGLFCIWHTERHAASPRPQGCPGSARSLPPASVIFRNFIVGIFVGELPDSGNYPTKSTFNGGERGIRTLGKSLQTYGGLANRCLQPLGHLSALKLKDFSYRSHMKRGANSKSLLQSRAQD
jgi:hypothetical protein